MYDELVAWLRSWSELPAHCECYESCDECDKQDICATFTNERIITKAGEAADAIEELSKPRWIPVTERLPECDLGAEVGNIEWISCGMVNAGCFGREGKYRDAYFRTWTDAGEGMDAKDADYWRAVTLPEPPKEDKDADN